MSSRFLHILFIFLISGDFIFISGSERLVSKPSLSFMSWNRVYSAREDSAGALWFYTIDGLIRYNGHSVSSFEAPLVKSQFAFDGRSHLYVNSGKSILFMDTARPDTLSAVPLPGIKVSGKTVMLSAGDSLFISDGCRIYLKTSETFRLFACTADSTTVTQLATTPGGELAVGTTSGIFLTDGRRQPRSVRTESPVSGLFAEPDCGTLLVGLVDGGFFRMDPESGITIDRFSDCGGKRMKRIRSFCRGGNGCIYAGGTNGLFRLGEDKHLEEVPVNGKLSMPLYEVYADSEGNLWASTVYEGVAYSLLTSCPFTSMPLPESHLLKGLAQDSEGTVWAATDGHGLFRLRAEGWSKVSGTEGVKYQGLFTIRGKEGIYAADWYGNLLEFRSTTSGTDAGSLYHAPSSETDNQVTSIYNADNEYLLGTHHGLFSFNSLNEQSPPRRIDCRIDNIYDIDEGPDGQVWFAGNGLARFSGGTFTYVIPPGKTMVYDIDIDEDGILWGCDRKSVFRVNDDDVTIIKEFSSHDAYKLEFLDGNRLLVLAGRQVMVFDTVSGESLTYGEEFGLTFGATRFSRLMKDADGKIWIAGDAGIEIFDPGKAVFRKEYPALSFDRISTRSHTLWLNRDKITLGHDDNHIVFDISNHDCTGILTSDIEYKLDGFDKEWKRLEEIAPVPYMNLRPGNYSMRVRYNPSTGSELSCRIRIKPSWYASAPAIAAEILVLLGILILFMRNRYSKAVLKEKLRLKDEEYDRQTSFFINLSLRMRTPINLIIGQLEKYFKDYGMRSRGVEDIQEIYSRTKDLRSMISDYVDSQDEALEREPRNAKIINAILGTIERNLFTRDLNVSLLCDELNMGKTKLTAVVKEATGMSPGEYVEDTRLHYAAEMLKNGNYTVGEVSDRLGFSSASYFSTRFKKKYGLAPSAWAESVPK